MSTSIKNNSNLAPSSELRKAEGAKGDCSVRGLSVRTRSLVGALALSLFQTVGVSGDALAATPQTDPAVEKKAKIVSPEEAPDVLRRIVVIGASVSDGYEAYITGEDGRPIRSPCGQQKLADLLDLAIIGEHGRVISKADLFFAFNPAKGGEKMVQEALKKKPTLVIAVDFLFWFAMGENGADLENGLKLLERFKCPVVIGNVPDLSQAKFFKDDGTTDFFKNLPVINQRIGEWAHEHPNVTVVDLDEFNNNFSKGNPTKIGNVELSSDPKMPLFQGDGLHLTAEGMATLASFAMAKVAETRPEIQPSRLLTDPKKVIEEMRRMCKEKMAKMSKVGDQKK